MEVAQRIGQAVSFSTCLEEWQELQKDYENSTEIYKEYRQTAEKYHSQRKACKFQIDRQLKKIKLLKSALQSSEINKASEDSDDTITSALAEEANCEIQVEFVLCKHLVPSDQEKHELLVKIDEKKRSLEDLNNFLPRKNGFYLSLIVGQVNMIFDNTSEKFRYKDEYEKFKLYCSITMLFYAVVLCFLMSNRVVDATFSFLLLWYYCTLTVRESILVVNGSRIKGWWVMHHYVSVALSGINVLWPDDQPYREFRPVFMAFSIYQSLVQLMQYYYQSGCLYRLRALGERHDMDITVEGFQSWMWRGLTFLLPFLFLGHLWQLYNAFTLLTIAVKYNFSEWQVPAIGFLFFVLFCGNFFTTISVVIQKQKKRGMKGYKKE